MANKEIAKELPKFETKEEALAFLQKEGIELSDVELDEIAGGTYTVILPLPTTKN